MKFKMRDEDRRAMDVLMDRATTAMGQSAGAAVFASADPRLSLRIAEVEKVLLLLDHLEASEPPPHLLTQTLQRIQQTTTQEVRPRESVFASQPPVA